MRAAGSLTGLAGLRPRDHVCWVVEDESDFAAHVAGCLQDGAQGNDQLVVFAPEEQLSERVLDHPDVTVADPRVAFLDGGPLDPAAMYRMFRREAATARERGRRALRVVADMDWLLVHRPDPAALLAFELLLDAVVIDVGATVLCAYRTSSFGPAHLAAAVAAHPLGFGAAPADPGFRMWSCGTGSWDVVGEIDLSGAAEFRTALTAAAAHAPALRLRMAGTRFVDLAGVRALVAVAREHPDLPIAVERPPETFRRCWSLLELDRFVPTVVVLPLRHDERVPGATADSA